VVLDNLYIAGEFLGCEGLASGRRTRTLIAVEDSAVCAIPFRIIEKLAAEHPHVQHWFHRIISKELIRAQ